MRKLLAIALAMLLILPLATGCSELPAILELLNRLAERDDEEPGDTAAPDVTQPPAEDETLTVSADKSEYYVENAAVFSVQAMDGAAYEWHAVTASGDVALADSAGVVSGAALNALTVERVTYGLDGAEFYCVVTVDGVPRASERYALTVLRNDSTLTSRTDSFVVTVKAYESFRAMETMRLELEELTAIELSEVSYQWYVSYTNDFSTARGIPSAVDSALEHVVYLPGDLYYFIEVSCTDAEGRTLTCSSEGIHVVITDVNGFPQAASEPYADLDYTYQFPYHANRAVAAGLMEAADAFMPENVLDCAHAIALVARMHQLYNEGVITLADMADDPGCAEHIAYALNAGIVGEDWFEDYAADCTRLDFARMVYSAFPTHEFVDVNSVADNAIPDVTMDMEHGAIVYGMYRAGVLTGMTDERFEPDAAVTRLDAAYIAVRLLDRDARLRMSITGFNMRQLWNLLEGFYTTATHYVWFTYTDDGAYGFLAHTLDTLGTRGIGEVTDLSIEYANAYSFTVYFAPAEEAADAQDLLPIYMSVIVDIGALDDDDASLTVSIDGGAFYTYYYAGPVYTPS
ncbi:MAG: S-layer homology domain-containing protein [Clostridia bacterium]|nr:S-layer homology domain-containing protein [Clostridia bacterium]